MGQTLKCPQRAKVFQSTHTKDIWQRGRHFGSGNLLLKAAAQDLESCRHRPAALARRNRSDNAFTKVKGMDSAPRCSGMTRGIVSGAARVMAGLVPAVHQSRGSR
jgi:hypothetical protein